VIRIVSVVFPSHGDGSMANVDDDAVYAKAVCAGMTSTAVGARFAATTPRDATVERFTSSSFPLTGTLQRTTGVTEAPSDESMSTAPPTVGDSCTTLRARLTVPL